VTAREWTGARKAADMHIPQGRWLAVNATPERSL
jgi:hypothetical protein